MKTFFTRVVDTTQGLFPVDTFTEKVGRLTVKGKYQVVADISDVKNKRHTLSHNEKIRVVRGQAVVLRRV